MPAAPYAVFVLAIAASMLVCASAESRSNSRSKTGYTLYQDSTFDSERWAALAINTEEGKGSESSDDSPEGIASRADVSPQQLNVEKDTTWDVDDKGKELLAKHNIKTDPEVNLWNTLVKVRRKGWRRSKYEAWRHQFESESRLFVAEEFYDWMIFVFTVMAIIPGHILLLRLPSDAMHHGLAFCLWIGVAAAFNLVVALLKGSSAGVEWLTGCLLELLFSVDTIFVMQVVIATLKVPRVQARKAMLLVICGQVVFEMVFFMGLAQFLLRVKVLPYFLGVWLICAGFWSLYADNHETSHNSEDDGVSNKILRQLKLRLGDRFWNDYDKERLVVVHKEKHAVTLLGCVVAMLFIVDFLMEIDVVLTKIEEIPNSYTAFTSSALATFALADLFFLIGDVMQRVTLMKYAVCFILFFFGMQMLMIDFICIPAIASCAVTVLIMLVTAAISWYYTPEQPSVQIEEGQSQQADTTGNVCVNA